MEVLYVYRKVRRGINQLSTMAISDVEAMADFLKSLLSFSVFLTFL